MAGIEFNDPIRFKVQVCIEADGDLFWEDFSGKVHQFYKDADAELKEAQNDPRYVGYEFMIEDFIPDDN